MAGAGDDSPRPLQASLDTSPSEIKLFLGTQVPGGQEVTVNRAALQSLSPVFNSMLTHNMVERIQGQVRLEHVSLETWNVISAFYFSGEELVCMDNVEEIVRVADMYELTKLKDHCDAVLCKEAGRTDDPVQMLNWASMYTLVELKEKFLNVVRNDFVHLCKNKSFSELKKDVLLEIVRGPYLVGDELAVCLAVMRWLEAQNADGRTVEELFQHLRLNEVCLCCLEKHVAECENARIEEVVNRLVEGEKQARKNGSPDTFPLQYLAFCDIRHDSVRHCFPQRSTRPFGQQCMSACSEVDGLVFIGKDKTPKDGPSKIGILHVNGTLSDQLTIPVEWNISRTVACLFDDFLVLVRNWMNHHTYFYNLKTKVWSEGPLMRHSRSYHALVSMGDAMFAVMGQEGNRLLPSIEMLTKDSREWCVAGQMQQAAFYVSATTAGIHILAIGKTMQELNPLQCFNTETKAAFVIENVPEDKPCVPLFGCGSQGALFLLGDQFKFLCPSSDGNVSMEKLQLPDLRGVFEVEDSCTDTKKSRRQQRLPKKRRLSREKAQIPLLVQHDLAGKRANLTLLPSLVNTDVKFAFRL